MYLNSQFEMFMAVENVVKMIRTAQDLAPPDPSDYRGGRRQGCPQLNIPSYMSPRWSGWFKLYHLVTSLDAQLFHLRTPVYFTSLTSSELPRGNSDQLVALYHRLNHLI